MRDFYFRVTIICKCFLDIYFYYIHRRAAAVCGSDRRTGDGPRSRLLQRRAHRLSGFSIVRCDAGHAFGGAKLRDDRLEQPDRVPVRSRSRQTAGPRGRVGQSGAVLSLPAGRLHLGARCHCGFRAALDEVRATRLCDRG